VCFKKDSQINLAAGIYAKYVLPQMYLFVWSDSVLPFGWIQFLTGAELTLFTTMSRPALGSSQP